MGGNTPVPVIAAIDGLEVAPQSHLDVEPRPAHLHHRGSLVAVCVAEPGHLASLLIAPLPVLPSRWYCRLSWVRRPAERVVRITPGPAVRPGRPGRATPAAPPGTACPGPPRCPPRAAAPRSLPRSSG